MSRGADDLPERSYGGEENGPEVTVIIPTRNRRTFLVQSVSDALRQENVAVEVVIVDDGSTDADALQDVRSLDERVAILHHPSCRGVARARNTGIDHARGSWLAFLDDDDRWSPHKLRTQLDAAAASGASWAYSAAATVDTDNRVLWVTPAPDETTVMRWLLGFNAFPGGCSNVIARADLVRAVGGFDERLSLIADWDLWIRLAEAGAPAACSEFLVGYRLHPDNMHIRDGNEIDGELHYVARKYETTRLGQPVRPDLSVFLGWQGNATRRTGRRRAAARIYGRRWWITRDPRDLGRIASALVGQRITRDLVRRRYSPLQLPWLDAEASPRTATGTADSGPPIRPMRNAGPGEALDAIAPGGDRAHGECR